MSLSSPTIRLRYTTNATDFRKVREIAADHGLATRVIIELGGITEWAIEKATTEADLSNFANGLGCEGTNAISSPLEQSLFFFRNSFVNNKGLLRQTRSSCNNLQQRQAALIINRTIDNRLPR